VSNNASGSNQLAESVLVLAGLGIIVLILNGILWACQEVTSGDSRAELNEKKSRIEGLKKEVEKCQFKVESYKALATGNSLDSETYDSYKSDLENCNAMVDEYNQLVPVVNELNRKVNSRFYLIPIPRRAAKAVN
jgi:hypothetical protein